MSSSGWSCGPRRDARRRRCTDPGSPAGIAARSARPAGSRRGPTVRGRARGGRSGGRRRVRRRSAAAGRSRDPGWAGTPPGTGCRPGRTTSRRQRLHSRSSVVRRSAVARIPRFVRMRRTRPEIGSASRSSSPRSIRASATSRIRSAPGSSVIRPATFQVSGASTRPLEVTGSSGRAPPSRPWHARRRCPRRCRCRATRGARRGARSPSGCSGASWSRRPRG